MTTKEYPKVINYLQYNHNENPGEINNADSETVPNQAFTVKEVLIRFNNGTLPNIVQPVFYDDTDDFDNIDPTLDPAFDIVDAENILNDIKIARLEKSKQKEAKDYEMSKKEKADSDEDMYEDDKGG